jgi:transposase InsO family protein
MLHEMIQFSTTGEWTCAPESRSMWASYPKQLMGSPEAESEQWTGHLQEKPRFLAQPCMGGKSENEKNSEKGCAASNPGHPLFQEVFFFCTVKKVGDVPGAKFIFVETVVDRDSGIAFAKVYSARNAMNAVDILASRVIPFFERQGVTIKEIHTRKASEYCGLPPAHPYETFLATSHIEHLEIDHSRQPHNYRCEQFYRLLLKEFFPLALRRTFQLSLGEMQKDLDAFVKDYNSKRMKHDVETEIGLFFADN